MVVKGVDDCALPLVVKDEVKHPVKVTAFKKHVYQRHRNSDHLFSEEYEVSLSLMYSTFTYIFKHMGGLCSFLPLHPTF